MNFYFSLLQNGATSPWNDVSKEVALSEMLQALQGCRRRQQCPLRHLIQHLCKSAQLMTSLGDEAAARLILSCCFQRCKLQTR